MADPLVRRIKSGADIFRVGDVVPLPEFTGRVVRRIVRTDYVEYVVMEIVEAEYVPPAPEPVQPAPPPPPLRTRAWSFLTRERKWRGA